MSFIKLSILPRFDSFNIKCLTQLKCSNKMLLKYILEKYPAYSMLTILTYDSEI
uniref:Uncharacterized protein n=1 Tax=Anguilla anguilla TaxID=7936 RepID=A0A0E9UI47_ANGAN